MFGFYGTCTYTRWKREASQCRLLKKHSLSLADVSFKT